MPSVTSSNPTFKLSPNALVQRSPCGLGCCSRKIIVFKAAALKSPKSIKISIVTLKMLALYQSLECTYFLCFYSTIPVTSKQTRLRERFCRQAAKPADPIPASGIAVRKGLKLGLKYGVGKALERHVGWWCMPSNLRIRIEIMPQPNRLRQSRTLCLNCRLNIRSTKTVMQPAELRGRRNVIVAKATKA